MSSTSVSTGVVTASVTKYLDGKGYLNSIQLFGDGVNAATVNVYDNTTNSGKIIAKVQLPAATASSIYVHYMPNFAIRCDNALTVEIIGTGASAIVNYGAT